MKWLWCAIVSGSARQPFQNLPRPPLTTKGKEYSLTSSNSGSSPQTPEILPYDKVISWDSVYLIFLEGKLKLTKRRQLIEGIGIWIWIFNMDSSILFCFVFSTHQHSSYCFSVNLSGQLLCVRRDKKRADCGWAAQGHLEVQEKHHFSLSYN